MNWFGESYERYDFSMFSASHISVLAFVIFLICFLYKYKERVQLTGLRKVEVGTAVFLLLIEAVYHIWMIVNGNWYTSHAIPLELCSISLFLGVFLLFTEKKIVYEILLFTGLLGASQALITPELKYDFPHFRFFHFFIVHIFVFSIPLYFTWVKGFRPTMYSIVKLMIFLNVLMPFVMIVNKLTGGNYMYLSRKPESASLLDLLGPYPWYIASLELLAFSLSIVIWLLLRKREAAEPVEKNFRRRA
ncbi:YwaF family protein [Domibacillus epiphyticus]|uniref:ABC transporter permease n=1 Tax=Domibacillus epiphyticus TaxID=1714355 RepID=A0A1V2A4U9_9BACI|nr:TIGR02206 family membrane protein [Domibacillus epiphyticus]OMP66038.1 hypothetical protein BTO28_14705 [Domibacillus epiphyticus]